MEKLISKWQTCNFTKSKIPLEKYFKDFAFFLPAYIENCL